ncbi:MAG: secondary thiamine-phosphate synthase enzyme YjbQ [Magnetospirillum sp.]
MRQAQTTLLVPTAGRGLVDFTSAAARFVADSAIAQGLLSVFIRHTSASLTIQENADPDVLADLNDFFGRLVADDSRLYRHTLEGPDDMPAHIRAALTATHLSVPVNDGRLCLGTWQGLYVFEHRTHPHRRSVVLHLMGR